MENLFIEIIGWVASLLILGAYYLNIRGKIRSDSPLYIWSNLIGGVFFAINTWWHEAFPSAALNVVWVFIALAALGKKRRLKSRSNPEAAL